jgi:hypothetical protein
VRSERGKRKKKKGGGERFRGEFSSIQWPSSEYLLLRCTWACWRTHRPSVCISCSYR